MSERHRTIAGLTLKGGSGDWTTLDGRYTISLQEGYTECDCAVRDEFGNCQHPDGMRTYMSWGIWDNQADDWWGGSGPSTYETLTEAAQDLAKAQS